MAQPGNRVTVEEYEQLYEELKNWGRWGTEDVLGTLNFITDDTVVAAVQTIRTGRRVSLSLPVNTESGPDNPVPAIHYMSIGHDNTIGEGAGRFATDFLGIDFHGESQSHLDALCHVSYQGKLYNGHSTGAVTTRGSSILTVDDYRHGIVGRGVLIDIPRLRDVQWLEPGEWVTIEELKAAEESQEVHLRSGDILVFRTGQHRRRLRLGPWDNNRVGRAGLHPTSLRLLADREVAAFAADGDGETIPSPVDGIDYPIHPLQISAMGMAAFDNLQFEELVEVCEEERRWEFLFVSAPLRIGGGTGSPVNPIAIF